MKLRYRLTPLDVVRASIRAILYNRALMTYLSVFFCVLIGISLKNVAHEGKPLAFIFFLAVFQLVAIAAFIVFGLTITTGLSLLIGKGRGIIGEHELEISDAGLSERTEFNDSLHRWKGVTAVRETSSFYVVRVNESGGANHVIPKKGRVIDGDLAPFIEEIKRRIPTANKSALRHEPHQP